MLNPCSEEHDSQQAGKLWAPLPTVLFAFSQLPPSFPAFLQHSCCDPKEGAGRKQISLPGDLPFEGTWLFGEGFPLLRTFPLPPLHPLTDPN